MEVSEASIDKWSRESVAFGIVLKQWYCIVDISGITSNKQINKHK